MWNCKHCKQPFNFERRTEKANHTRHCSANPNKAASYINVQRSFAAYLDRTLGEVKPFHVTCAFCSKSVTVKERELQFPSKEKYYCSASCRNNRQEWWNNNLKGYRTIAFRHHPKQCIICGFDKVVAVHHIDEDRSNNSPSNLIPLCPNHHEMYHSEWKDEVEPFIKEYQQRFICAAVT